MPLVPSGSARSPTETPWVDFAHALLQRIAASLRPLVTIAAHAQMHQTRVAERQPSQRPIGKHLLPCTHRPPAQYRRSRRLSVCREHLVGSREPITQSGVIGRSSFGHYAPPSHARDLDETVQHPWANRCSVRTSGVP